MPGGSTGHAVLSRLVRVDPEVFARDHWGRQALLSRAEELPSGFGDLLSADTVDELVSERGLRTPFLRVAKNGSTLAERTFTAPGGVGAGIADSRFVLTASAPGTPDPSTGIDHGRAAPGSPPATAVGSRVDAAHPRGGRS